MYFQDPLERGPFRHGSPWSGPGPRSRFQNNTALILPLSQSLGSPMQSTVLWQTAARGSSVHTGLNELCYLGASRVLGGAELACASIDPPRYVQVPGEALFSLLSLSFHIIAYHWNTPRWDWWASSFSLSISWGTTFTGRPGSLAWAKTEQGLQDLTQWWPILLDIRLI